jgi:hypothetical protein
VLPDFFSNGFSFFDVSAKDYDSPSASGKIQSRLLANSGTGS